MVDVVEDVCAWCTSASASALAADLVPGADADERRSLAALGGVISSLVGPAPASWPEAVHHWLGRGPRPPAQLVARLRKAGGTEDRLASIYENLVSGPNRRALGTFFTPRPVVELMLHRAQSLLPAPAVVVDPGAGVGAFTIPARTRWPTAEVVAVDVNAVTLGLLAASAALEGRIERLRLVHADFLQWVTHTAAASSDEGSRLLLGNPPYTRHQEMDAKAKAAAMEAAAGLVDSGLAGLAAYFLGASLCSLRPQDALCFVLPGSWTETRYGRPLREWIWTSRSRHVELLAFPPSVEVFPGTRVTAVVLVVGPETSAPKNLVVEQVTTVGNRLETTNERQHNRQGPGPASFSSLLWPRTPSGSRQTVELAKLGRVRRGVATGANHFFFLDDDDASSVPDRLLRPGVRRLRHVEGDVLGVREHNRIGGAGHPRWLLSLTGPADVRSKAVSTLIEAGVEAGYNDRYLTRDRKDWFVVEHVEAPDLLVALMSKGRFRAVRNVVGAVPSNSMYGIYLNDRSTARELCEWLNSDEGQAAIRACARHYSNGLLKLEPHDYLRVAVPS